MGDARLLVKVRGDGKQFTAAAGRAFGATAVDVEPILTIPPAGTNGAGLAPASGSTWLRVGAGLSGATDWDAAHELIAPGRGIADGDLSGIEMIEPDIFQTWPLEPPGEDGAGGPLRGKGAAPAVEADRCAFLDQDGEGGKARGAGLAWNLENAYSELAKAQEQFGDALEEKLGKIIIAHLDTGYDPAHITCPANLDRGLQRNFVDAGTPGDASDRTPPGSGIRNRGHGTATVALLAGNRLDGTSPGWPGFTGALGGAPFARIIPIRIADWVVRFSTSAMVQGFDYARQHGAHVLSMSMGGLTSAALVDAINLAYDAGMVMVTAAGNNFADLPTSSIVFPARYRRVLAACGVMADGRAYTGLDVDTMQGNYGPRSKMETALGAYTPNVPWAVIDCGKVVGMDGAGTSSATPQIAAAAALWLAEHLQEVKAYPQPWMRVEAVRQALFSSAQKSSGEMGPAETFEKIGKGVLKAHAALAVQPAAAGDLVRLPPAEASWGWLGVIVGGGVSLAPGPTRGRAAMFALELTQMAQRVAAVDQAIGDPDLLADAIPAAARNRYLEAALDAGNPSKALKARLEHLLGRTQVGTGGGASTSTQIIRKPKQLPPPKRRLRVYALDPSIAKSLDYVSVNETTLSLPWEEELEPGPVGEYIEVVDVDPASNKLYDPVDLNEPKLLAQDGWPPSEGNPQFHQQMVYAVAMKTIGHFEEALGRKALWASRSFNEEKQAVGVEKQRERAVDEAKSREVSRLRIYPHALRTQNAYYSPEKVALLFGYFRSPQSSEAPATSTMVFSCLSSDIIAHEMSHALLDGLHRRFQEASNPDVPAFHEAFADIVALFQHFSIPELVRFQMAQARGKLSAARLLGGLAKQFGEHTQRQGPLRDYLSDESRKLDYATATEVHDRGSILVSVVFDAFIRIVDRRSADLIRIATYGTGVLPKGALHPDLVNRLTDEACKTARHVLRMCIRALDYCPAVDITFGEYLRALITADIDLVPNDRYYYRLAFIEAFRNRGILPGDVRTVSEETLAWSTPDDSLHGWFDKVATKLDLRWDRRLDRSEIFRLNIDNRWTMWRGLKSAFKENERLYTEFGLLRDIPRYDSKFEVIRRPNPRETTFDVFSVRPARRVAPDGSFRTEVIATIHQRRPELVDPDNPAAGYFWFRGGATLIFDPREKRVRYSIIKNVGSESRLKRQRETTLVGFMSPLRKLYFGNALGEPFAMLHADHSDESEYKGAGERHAWL